MGGATGRRLEEVRRRRVCLGCEWWHGLRAGGESDGGSGGGGGGRCVLPVSVTGVCMGGVSRRTPWMSWRGCAVGKWKLEP